MNQGDPCYTKLYWSDQVLLTTNQHRTTQTYIKRLAALIELHESFQMCLLVFKGTHKGYAGKTNKRRGVVREMGQDTTVFELWVGSFSSSTTVSSGRTTRAQSLQSRHQNFNGPRGADLPAPRLESSKSKGQEHISSSLFLSSFHLISYVKLQREL